MLRRNDTGPIHIAATFGSPTVALFGAASNSTQSGPCIEAVTVLRRVPLAGLPVAEIIKAAESAALLAL